MPSEFIIPEQIIKITLTCPVCAHKYKLTTTINQTIVAFKCETCVKSIYLCPHEIAKIDSVIRH